MGKFYLYIACLNALDLLAVIFGKLWSLTGKNFYLFLCAIGFALAGLFFALSLKYEGAAVVNVLWIAISVALVTIAGYFVFKETITVWQWIGIGTVLMGVVFLNIR